MTSVSPDFTGSQSQSQPREIVKASLPFKIRINMVDGFAAGKRTSRYFIWHVELRDERILYHDPYKQPYPKTRKAAIVQARRAIHEWCAHITYLPDIV